MLNRLEHVLDQICAQTAPHLLGERIANVPQRLAHRAAQLTKHGVLLLVGETPSTNHHQRVQQWVMGYLDLYRHLTNALFPSYSAYHADYADEGHPPIVVIYGRSLPVICVIGQLIIPYIAQRQYDLRVTDAEIRGIVETALDELEAGDLPRPAYESVRRGAIVILRELLNAPVRQIWLNETWLTEQAAPPPPNSLPEDMPTEILPSISSPPHATSIAREPDIPVFFRRGNRPSGWRKVSDN